MAKKIKDKYEVLGVKLWDKFDAFMESNGFYVNSYNTVNMGRCSHAANQKEHFVPIFKFILWYRGSIAFPNYISIHVDDRNGNTMLDGKMVGCYSLDVKETDDFDLIESRFDTLLQEVFQNFGGYCRTNRLDAVFNNVQEDRKKF